METSDGIKYDARVDAVDRKGLEDGTTAVDFASNRDKEARQNDGLFATDTDRRSIPFYGSYPEDRVSKIPASPSNKKGQGLSESTVQKFETTCLLDDNCMLKPPSEIIRSVRTDICFGDGKGTTACVNELGEFVCAQQILDLGPLGLIKAKPNHNEGSGDIYQTLVFDDMIHGRRHGFGLRLLHQRLVENESSCVEYVHDHWPRILLKYENLDTEIQFAIKDKSLIQHYTLRSRATIEATLGFDVAVVFDDNYREVDDLKAACQVEGGVFTTGSTAVALASGPGGHIEFLASLFEGTEPVALNCHPREYSEYEPEDNESFWEHIPTDHDSFKLSQTLMHEHRVNMSVSECRTFTAIYRFDQRTRPRDEVYSMRLITVKPYLNEKQQPKAEEEQRKKEQDYLSEYEKLKAAGNYENMRRLLEHGTQTDCDDKASVSESKSPIDSEQTNMNRNKSFSNWGGENMLSHRLLGIEWHKRQDVDGPDDWDVSKSRRALFDKEFARIRQRIRKDQVAQTTSSNTWTSQYRPFGSRFTGHDDLVQGAINFLKLFDAWQNLPLEQDYIFHILANRLKGWLAHLLSSQNKKSGLWEEGSSTEHLPREEDPYYQFYEIRVPRYNLCQSILIWQAICAIHTLVDYALTSSQICDSNLSYKIQVIVEESNFKSKISPIELRSLILDRFSFDHTSPTYELLQMSTRQALEPKVPNQKGQLLAISRKGTEKPRFHWNVESIILCPGYDGGFFDKDPRMKSINEVSANERIEVWRASLGLQDFQHEALWKKPTRYVLALILASNSKFSMDKSMDTEAMIKRCNSVLLRSIHLDGTVAVELDPVNKTPHSGVTPRMDVTFQVPHFLLRQQYLSILSHQAKEAFSSTSNDFRSSDAFRRQQQIDYRHGKSVRSLKKRGFYATVNEANIFENPCEPDWLFDDPDIFTSDARPCDEPTIEKEVTDIVKGLEDWDIPQERKTFLENLVEFYRDNNSTFMSGDASSTISVVDDVIRSDEDSGIKRITETVCWASELLEHLRSKRERGSIKKRLVSIKRCTSRMAGATILGAIGVEKFYVPDFLTRHQKRESFLRDETRKELNTWVTELHLSFHSVLPRRDNPEDSGDEDEESEDDIYIFQRNSRPCPGKKDWKIEKGIISVHFFGDLNDRYWTSHVLYNIPGFKHEWLADDVSFNLAKPSGAGNKNTFHSQRKILEARWFANAADYIVKETKRILEYAADVIRKDDIESNNPNERDNFSRTFDQNKKIYILYGDLIKFLFTVHESLRSTKKIADEWDNRAAFREAQPRWTRDDEAAYREEILIWHRKSKAHIQMIEALRQRIESMIEHIKQLRAWLLEDLSLKEARMSNRSADDVRIFTYATVIFLPLSFASSLFSMAGPPSNSTTRTFVVAAAVALIATLAFVLNAGTPIRVITYYKNKMFDLPQDDFVKEHGLSQWWGVLQTFRLWFVDMPSRRVLASYDFLTERGDIRKRPKEKDSPSNDRPSTPDSVKTDKDAAAARKRLEETEQRRKEFKRKQKLHKDATTVALGVLLFPLFVIVYIIRFILVNTWDLIKLLFYILPPHPSRRTKRELFKDGDDHKFILSTDPDSSSAQARKKGKVASSSRWQKEKDIRDLRHKKEKYQRHNLQTFMKTPRINDVSRHLQKGESFGQARELWKREKMKQDKELEDKKEKYEDALRKVGEDDGTHAEKEGGGENLNDANGTEDDQHGKTDKGEGKRDSTWRSVQYFLLERLRGKRSGEKDPDGAEKPVGEV
ncbi:MAG: hypothetical protein Q9167_001086 [Letrouitia subvulpina]